MLHGHFLGQLVSLNLFNFMNLKQNQVVTKWTFFQENCFDLKVLCCKNLVITLCMSMKVEIMG